MRSRSIADSCTRRPGRKAHVCRLETDGGWTDLGRLGDALEINALSVYNGQLYGGTIPRAEVFRFNPTVEPWQTCPACAPEPKPQRRVRTTAAPPELGQPGVDVGTPISRPGRLRVPGLPTNGPA